MIRRCADALRRIAGPRRSPEEDDAEKVAAAARLLQISEFDFFRVAYAGWYGKEILEKETERFFSRYLLRREIPCWVRHLARRVRELHSRNALDPREFGVNRPPPLRENSVTRLVGGLLLGAIYAFFFLTLAGYVSPR